MNKNFKYGMYIHISLSKRVTILIMDKPAETNQVFVNMNMYQLLYSMFTYKFIRRDCVLNCKHLDYL